MNDVPAIVPELDVSDLAASHPALDGAHQRLLCSDAPFVVRRETKIYRTGSTDIQVDQFVIADPDGYLVRLQQQH